MLDTNRLTAGPMMSRFEREIASIHGCKYGLMCDSGTRSTIARADKNPADGATATDSGPAVTS